MLQPQQALKKQLDFVLVNDENPAGSHRIDKEPITEQNSRGMGGKISRDERQRIQYEGSSASRRQQRGARGNSTRRQAKEARVAHTSKSRKSSKSSKSGRSNKPGKPRRR